MFTLPILFGFALLAFVWAAVASVASSKKDFALLASVSRLGLGALEAVFAFFGG